MTFPCVSFLPVNFFRSSYSQCDILYISWRTVLNFFDPKKMCIKPFFRLHRNALAVGIRRIHKAPSQKILTRELHLAFRHLTKKIEKSTVLCSVEKHVGSGLSTKEVGGNTRHSRVFLPTS